MWDIGCIPAALSQLDEAGHALRFLTNTDFESTSAIVERVRWKRVDIRGGEVFATAVGGVRDFLSYDLLDSAFRALHSGAELIALQRGWFFLAEGHAHLDNGALGVALEYAAKTCATVVGKPSPGPDYLIDSLADFPELLSRKARAVS